MVNLIIVEDDENKRNRVIDFLKGKFSINPMETYNSYQSGIKGIIKNHQKTDLLLLDMSMSTFDIEAYETGGRRRPFAGREILEKMKWENIKIPTIIVTAYENFEEDGKTFSLQELCKELSESFDGIYVGCVYYNSAQNSWMDRLGKFILEVKENVENTNS